MDMTLREIGDTYGVIRRGVQWDEKVRLVALLRVTQSSPPSFLQVICKI